MEKNSFKIPGTNIKVGGIIGAVLSGDYLGNFLSPFLNFGPGLLLSQITHIADNLTKETIQNWVKRHYVDPPRKGRFYDENQVARILLFNSLRRTVELDDIKLLLQLIHDTSHGTLEERELLELFNGAVIETRDIVSGDFAGYEKTIGAELAVRLENKEGDQARIKQVIYIMLTAYRSSLLRQQAENMLLELKAKL